MRFFGDCLQPIRTHCHSLVKLSLVLIYPNKFAIDKNSGPFSTVRHCTEKT